MKTFKTFDFAEPILFDRPMLNPNDIYYDVVELILFDRRQLHPKATVISMLPLIAIVEKQNNLRAKNAKQFCGIFDILEKSINWN